MIVATAMGFSFFTLPLVGRVDAPTGPARFGRPDDRLRASGWGSFIQFNDPHPQPLPTRGRGGPWGAA